MERGAAHLNESRAKTDNISRANFVLGSTIAREVLSTIPRLQIHPILPSRNGTVQKGGRKSRRPDHRGRAR